MISRLGKPAARAHSPGFTLLEITIVLFIMAVITFLIVPKSTGYQHAQLRTAARELAGRETYLFDRAEAQKVVMRLIFDLDHNAYAVAKLDPYAQFPQFVPDPGYGSQPVNLGDAISIRDVTVGTLGTFDSGVVATEFYPSGYVDPTLVHLVDTHGTVMTLALNPLTGQVAIASGDLSMEKMMENP